MKVTLTKAERNLLQRILTVVYSFNKGDKKFLQQFFSSEVHSFEKLYPILEETIFVKTDKTRLVPKNEANYLLGKSGLLFNYREYFEAIYFQQQQYALQFPELIVSPDTAIAIPDQEKAGTDNARLRKLKKIMWYLVIANSILGAWLLLKWS